jgi:hypothetical protein
LPFDSTLLFILDDPISSKSSKGGQMVRAHLRSDLIVGGRTVAAAGTPAQIRILDASASSIADQYGFVDIFFEPLTLPDGRVLPLRTPIARLTPNVTSGHESTVSTEDTVGDIFVPYYSIWQIVRMGKNFVLGAGSVVSANTEATLAAQPNGTIAIVTPRPLHAGLRAERCLPALPLAPIAVTAAKRFTLSLTAAVARDAFEAPASNARMRK